MTIRFKLMWVIFAPIVLCILLKTSIFAVDETELPESLDGGFVYSGMDVGSDAILDAAPDDVKDMLPDEFDPNDPEKILEIYTPSYFLETVWRIVKKSLAPALRILSSILGIIIISATVNSFSGLAKEGALSNVVGFVSTLCILLIVYSFVAELIENVTSYLQNISNMMNALLPVMTAIGLAGGNISGTAVASQGMLLMLSFIGVLSGQIFFPTVRVCFALSAASGLGAGNFGFRIDAISKFVRQVMGTILALIAAIISAVMTFQNSIAASADSLSMRAVKFTTSNAIPVAGGIASDAVGMVAGSLSAVKKNTGWVGIVIIMLITMPIIVKVLLSRLGIMLSSMAAGVLGLDKERTILDDISGLLGYVCAVCIIIGLMVIYSLVIISNTSAAYST